MKIKNSNLIKNITIFASTIFLSSNSMAYTLEEVVKSGFIDAGVFLFVGGLAILIIPRLTKLGIVFMLLGNAVVLARIFMSYEIIKFLDQAGYGEFFIGMDQNKFRIILACVLLLFMILLGLLGALKNWLWRCIWRPFGFYKKDEDRKKKKKELKQNKNDQEKDPSKEK